MAKLIDSERLPVANPTRLRTSIGLAVLLIAGQAAAAATPAVPMPVLRSTGKPFPVTVHEGTSMAVSVAPDGRLLALDLQGSLWILPVEGGHARRITDYFNDARQPVWSPNGKRLAFFGYRDGTYHLWTIAPDGSDLRQMTGGVYDDRDPAWSSDGKTIAFASDRADTGSASYNIWTLEVTTGKLRQITSGTFENRMPTWSPDGSEIAYSSLRGTSFEIWATARVGGHERLLRKGGRFEAPSWGSKGQLAYVTADQIGSHLQVDGKSVSGTESVFPFRVSWVPGTSDFFYVSDGKIRHRSDSTFATVPFEAALDVVRPHYVRVKRDFDSTTPRPTLGILKPTISPKGDKVAFIALGDLYVVPTTGGKPKNLTNDHALDADPAWSPDGTKLVYSSDKESELPQLWVRDLKSGMGRQITTMDTQPLGAAWSPDGTRIAFIDVDGRWGEAGVCLIDVATGKITRLQSFLAQPGEPSWSADGRFIALSLSKLYSKSFREGTNQVYVIATDGKSGPVWQVPDTNVSIDTRGGGGPAWSPDGTKMAAIYEGLVKVWPVAPDGTPLGSPRSYTSEMSHYPTWAADSKTILYQASDKLKTINIETGVITEIPLDLSYVLDKPKGRTIVHVSALVDAVHDETQHDKDIVIEGNRIVAITDHDPALHAQNANIVDGTGLTAIPGLIEHHAHAQKDFGAAGYRAWLAYGVTTVRDPGSQLYDGIENREASEAGVRIGPRIYTAGPLMEWRRVYYKMGVAISSPAHLRRELDLARTLKYDLLKSYVRMPDLQQRQIVEAAHAMGVPVTGHEIFPAAFNGLDATEHMGASSRRGYSPKQGPQGITYDDVIQLYGKTKRTVTPTLFGALGGYLAKHPSDRTDPRAKLYPKWAQDQITGDDPLIDLVGPLLGGSMRGMKDAYDAGALITAGTDTPVAINLHAEIAAYVEAGLTPFQALQTVTVNSAHDLNLDAGTLEAGKLADIVLIAGDPRKDISATFNVHMVIANGRSFTLDELLHPSPR
jgi:Tol biopolymer transport system component